MKSYGGGVGELGEFSLVLQLQPLIFPVLRQWSMGLDMLCRTGGGWVSSFRCVLLPLDLLHQGSLLDFERVRETERAGGREGKRGRKRHTASCLWKKLIRNRSRLRPSLVLHGTFLRRFFFKKGKRCPHHPSQSDQAVNDLVSELGISSLS